ncbi:hypothetical protein WA538_001368, partial [Blastocystis sp. DL]
MGRHKCVFCSIPHNQDQQRILYENDRLYVIKDIRPCAKHHFLVISKRHIYDCHSLKHVDLPLLEEMIEVGKETLRKQGATDDIILGFHRRPWHTIGHLHLHCIGLPFKNCWSKFSHSAPFLVSAEKVKGW